MTITFDSKAFKSIMDKLTFIEKSIKAMDARHGISRWMDEADVMLVTKLSKRSLRDKRKQGVFNFSSATGRKIKYLRKDVENYLDKNSTVKKQVH